MNGYGFLSLGGSYRKEKCVVGLLVMKRMRAEERDPEIMISWSQVPAESPLQIEREHDYSCWMLKHSKSIPKCPVQVGFISASLPIQDISANVYKTIASLAFMSVSHEDLAWESKTGVLNGAFPAHPERLPFHCQKRHCGSTASVLNGW
jgi:hypothetical protein